MKQDERIRERLANAAGPLTFDIEARLLRVRQTVGGRAIRRRGATAAFALGLALIGAVVVWRLVPADRGGDIVAPTGPAGSIAYTKVIGGRDTASIGWLDAESGARFGLIDGGFVAFPLWSPDGSRVAYLEGSQDDSYLDLFIANADGSNARRIVEGSVQYSFAWSPDGASIVWSGKGPDDTFGMWEVDSAGSEPRLVVGGDWGSVSWSPDGRRLLLAGYEAKREMENPQADLYTVAPDGSDLTKLTDDVFYEHWATWSPDGSRVVFARSEGYDDVDYGSDVYVIDADGSNRQRLSTWEGFDSFPVWSPDGAWIAFASDRGATPEQQRANREDSAFSAISMYVMRSDGSDVTPVLLAGPDEALLPSSWKA